MIKQAAKLLFLAFIFASCGSKQDQVQLQTLIEGLENSNRFIGYHNEIIIAAFQSRIHDPWHTSDDVKWFDKAKQVNQFTTSLLDSLNVVDTSLHKKSKLNFRTRAQALYEQLYKYKLSLLGLLDPNEFPERLYLRDQMQRQKQIFTKTIPLLASNHDTSFGKTGMPDAKAWLDSNFNNDNPQMCRAQIQKIKNDILITAQMLMQYFYEQKQINICMREWPTLISSLSSSYIKTGEGIEVTAGIGVFRSDIRPRFIIDGKHVDSKGEAITTYIFKPKGKPGKHTLRLQTELTMPDGTIMHHTKNLHYTIIE